MAASEAPPQPSPPTTLPAVQPSASNAINEPAIKNDSVIPGGGVSEEVMNLLRQLDARPSEQSGSGLSHSEQAHQSPGPSIVAPDVDPLVDLPSMTFAQALPRITQLAQDQKVMKHLRNVSRSTCVVIPTIHSFILPIDQGRAKRPRTALLEGARRYRESSIYQGEPSADKVLHFDFRGYRHTYRQENELSERT